MKRLELLKPLFPFNITQGFGGNFIIDYTKIFPGLKGHNGLDATRGCISGKCYAIEGAYIRASHDGTIYSVWQDDKGAWIIEVITDEQFLDINGQSYYWKTIYAHLLANPPVIKGQKVKVGDILGFADTTGFVTGPHLHWGLKPGQMIDDQFIKAFPNNGYWGAVDPVPYLSNLSAYEVMNTIQLASEIIRKVVEFIKNWKK